MIVALEGTARRGPPLFSRAGRILAVSMFGFCLLTLNATVPTFVPERSNSPNPASLHQPSVFHGGGGGVALTSHAPRGSQQHTVRLEPLTRPGFSAPVDRFVVSSTYGLRRMSWEADARLHRGIDLAAPLGDPVRAIADGVVTRVGWRGGYGLAIDIRHANGLVSTYAHLSGIGQAVDRGARLTGGTQIGEIGSTGSSTGPHLHLELRDGRGVSLDPGAYLGGGLAPSGLRQADAAYRRALIARSRPQGERAGPAPPKVVFVQSPRPASRGGAGQNVGGAGHMTYRTDRPPVHIGQARRNTITVRRD